MARKLARRLTARATADPPDDDGGDDQPKLSRRSYLLLAGTAVATVAGQTGDSGVASAKTADATTVNAPDTYGYGGGSVLSQPTAPEITAIRPLESDSSRDSTNKTITTAEEISLDTAVNSTLPADTSRWYALSVTEGQTIQVDFQRSDPSGVTALVLYDADGDFCSLRYTATDAPVQLLDTIETSETAYLQIVDVQNGDGDYTFTASVGESTPDAEESDEFTDFEEADTDESTERTIRIVAVSEESANYEFTVSGELEAGEHFPDGDWEAIDGSTANGWVSNDMDVNYDDFRFTGDIEAFGLLEGDADVFVDDEPWDPAELDDSSAEADDSSGDTDGSTDELTERTIRIVAVSEESANYEFAVSGELEAGEHFPDGDWEAIDGSTANGWVSNDMDVNYDDFLFTGDIEAFELLEGEADVFVDDDPWDPAELDDSSAETDDSSGDTDGSTNELTERTIRIVAVGDKSANYEFTVSGELEAGEHFPDGDWEAIDGSTANGWVSNDMDVNYDDFLFTGDIEAFELLEGDADVFVDDEPWESVESDDGDTVESDDGDTVESDDGDTVESDDGDTVESDGGDTTIDAELLEHRLIIIAVGEDSAHYNFSVTDTLRGGDQFPDGNWESITGNTADGWVSNDMDVNYDNFYYRGEIESFTILEGDAELRVDGESVDIESDGSVETPTPTDPAEIDENLGAQGYGMYEYGGISS
ncbi:hypothetical protein [Halalkalirubrum salinum]|uniref:hypothetical protein n=1 Tax=Halalkalirubrum salinum TaxID=2563889 RepID=UPI0010FB73C6|nr:hypothetical protein [Halalkalirubrum salinum]